MIPSKYPPEHNCDPQIPKCWKAGRTLIFCDGLWKESKQMKRYWEVCSKIGWDESNSRARGGNVHCPRGECFLSQRHVSVWHAPLAPLTLLRLTWYVPRGFAMMDVPSPKVAQQLLSSQLVMTVAWCELSIRVHFTCLAILWGPSAVGKCRAAGPTGCTRGEHACLLTAWLRTHSTGLLHGLLLYQLGAFVWEGILIQCAVFVLTVLFILRNWKHPEKHKI